MVCASVLCLVVALLGQTQGHAQEQMHLSDAAPGGTQMFMGSVSYVYWAEGGSIKRSPIDQQAVETLVTGLNMPNSIYANVYCQEQLYWTDTGSEVGRSNLDGTSPFQLGTAPYPPQGIVADPRHGTVYWSVGFTPDGIYVSLSNFSQAVRLTSFTDVQLGPVRMLGDKLYWVLQDCPGGNNCDNAVFQRCDRDGSNQETLFTLINTRVSDFFVDPLTMKLYWTTTAATLSRANMDGSGMEVLRTLGEMFARLAQEPGTGRIVWSDRNGVGGWLIRVGDADAQNASVVVNFLTAVPGGLSVAVIPATFNDCNQNGLEDNCEGVFQDCQFNGIHDSCDLASGTSADCDSNGIPDECGIDCQPNGIDDGCDIFSGTSDDCNANTIPDECEPECNANQVPDDCDITSGFSEDCNANVIPDECELTGNDCNTNQIPDDCEWTSTTDCDGNSILDECEVAVDRDCNGNAVHDACDIVSGFSLDVNADALPDECNAQGLGILGPEPGGLRKPRFISFTLSLPAAVSESTALRLWMMDLHHVIPPYNGGPTVPFSLFNGQAVWIGPPATYKESAASQVTFQAARTQCTPHYQDWRTVSLLHVTGSHIVPSSTYNVQQVSAACAGQEDTCFAITPRLEVGTSRWGDVGSPFNPPSPTVQPDLGDVAQIINKFRGVAGAPIKARVLITPSNLFGEVTVDQLSLDIGFMAINSCIDAFRGPPYPAYMGKCANSNVPCALHTDCGANGPCELYCPD